MDMHLHTFMSRRPPIAMLSLASIAVAGVSPPWRPATVRDLHSEYGNIFKHGNRNAASHLWVSFILQRASQLAPSKLEEMFTTSQRIVDIIIRASTQLLIH